jgi:hypothetical protein
MNSKEHRRDRGTPESWNKGLSLSETDYGIYFRSSISSIPVSHWNCNSGQNVYFQFLISTEIFATQILKIWLT